MPFQFNAVNEQLDGPQKANIFQPQGMGQPDPDEQKRAGITSTPVLGSAWGGQNSAKTPTVRPGAGSAPGAFIDPNTKQQAFDQLGPSSFGSQTADIKGSLGKASDKLQAEADQFSQKAKDTASGFRLTDEQLGKAADGDANAFKDVAGRLSKPQADQFGAFQGLGKDDIPTAANALKDPLAFGQIFQQGGADYSSGAQALDSLLLRRSNEFRNVAQQLSQEQDDILANNTKLQTDKTEEARKLVNDSYGAEQASARTRLQDMNKKIEENARNQEALVEAERRGLDPSQITAKELESLKAEIRDSLIRSGNPQNIRDVDLLEGNFDLTPYLNIDTDVDYKEFINQQQAEKFNRVNDLLGTGGPMMQAGTVSNPYTFDRQGAGSLIAETLKGRSQSRLAGEAEAATQKKAQDAAIAKQREENFIKAMTDLLAKQKADAEAERLAADRGEIKKKAL